jgi:hypothetical protein
VLFGSKKGTQFFGTGSVGLLVKKEPKEGEREREIHQEKERDST